jgi:SynChlorMet cassette protein ScmD
MKLSDKPIANPIVVLREEFDDWAVLFNPDTAGAVGINPVGVAVWKLLNGERNLKEITAHVKDEFYDVSETIDKEVTDFVDNLVESGFVGYALKEFD